MGRLPLEEHDGIAQLQSVFGGSRKEGIFGTGVTVQQVGPNVKMHAMALEAFQRYLGGYWNLYGAGLLTNWRESISILPPQAPWRQPLEQILNESGDDNLESSCDMLTDYWEDPAAARKALDGMFNGPDVEEMAIFSLDDGGIYYGMVVAVKIKSGKFVALVAVFDDHGY